jgi:RNA polymerase nonessential primary-like sigma factor
MARHTQLPTRAAREGARYRADRKAAGPRGRLDAAAEAAWIGRLTEARAALVETAARIAGIQAAGLRTWDLWIHTGRLTRGVRRSLLIEVERLGPLRARLRDLHDRAGCPRRPRPRRRDPAVPRGADYAALPLRPTWLLAQLDRVPNAPDLATARAAVVRWLSARNALVDALYGFVVALARRAPTWHVPLEERVQAGALALTVAIERFDATRRTRLTTYLGPAVERAIRRLEQRTPRRTVVPRAGIPTVSRAMSSAALGRGGTPPTNVRRPWRPEPTLVTLDGRGEDGAGPLTTWCVDREILTPEDRAILAVDAARARAQLARLQPREEEVLRLLFGLGDGKALGVRAVGAVVGVSATTVRRIRDRALAKLRRALTGTAPVAPPRSIPLGEVSSCPIPYLRVSCSSSTSPSGPGARPSARRTSASTPRASPPTTRSGGSASSGRTPSIPSRASSAKRATRSTA